MNPITKAQAISRLYALIDDARLCQRGVGTNEQVWQGGRISACHDAIAIVKAIDSLDEMPEEDSRSHQDEPEGVEIGSAHQNASTANGPPWRGIV